MREEVIQCAADVKPRDLWSTRVRGASIRASRRINTPFRGFDPLVILVVVERGVGRDGTAPGGLHRRTKQRYVEYVLFPPDWLTVQSL